MKEFVVYLRAATVLTSNSDKTNNQGCSQKFVLTSGGIKFFGEV